MNPKLNHEFITQLSAFIPSTRLFTDALSCLTYGTDASFYRLIPQVVVRVVDEREVVQLLHLAQAYQTPLTFRAAGTSLSGQAVTDSVLVVLDGQAWRDYEILEQGREIRLQTGMIGANANALLAPFGRKIGPDPASINTCKIGGITANNASGMCCGTAHNSYHTLAGMRLILADGTILDTRDDNSVREFRRTHADFLRNLTDISNELRADDELCRKIRHKYRLKNTTGYGLNALLDFDDPIAMMSHLFIGSEGTLGFISEVNLHTVIDAPHKATSLVLFPDLDTACQAVMALKSLPVDAVELIDNAGLKSVAHKPELPDILRHLDPQAAALLIDVRAPTTTELDDKTALISTCLNAHKLLAPLVFTTDPETYQTLWYVRKGLFPAVGANRPIGTTVIIEDVAFPIESLAQGTRELQALFSQFHYHEAIIFGHALEGNLHFVFTQDFSTPAEITRYADFMQAVSELVAVKYGGSLKAEHGTGRNMAPFVRMEWGDTAYQLMWRIKSLFDPHNILNPGVILNHDNTVHVANLKPMPAAHALIDRCIECGFCEPICPSRHLTLTPRQRIVATRETARLRANNETTQANNWEQALHYAREQTCAADGLCATRCPVGIDTGALVQDLRTARKAEKTEKANQPNKSLIWLSQHLNHTTRALRLGLRVGSGAQSLLGAPLLTRTTRAIQKIGLPIPVWHTAMPRAAQPLAPPNPLIAPAVDKTVVYFSSCVTRTLGTANTDDETRDLPHVMHTLLTRAGYTIVTPEHEANLCCGLPFASQGHANLAKHNAEALLSALWQASEHGRLPVLCDTSPCTLELIEQLSTRNLPMRLYEPAGFILEHLLPHLPTIIPSRTPVALHITCSSRKMGLETTLRRLTQLCATQVIESPMEGCCGFAGDKGFFTPELNASALADLRQHLPAECAEGVSNSRSCEIGLSLHSDRHYRSIVYLVERCTRQSS